MTRFEFKLPDIGEGIVEGEIVKWLVAEGDRVDEDQPMVEVMTDKATVVIPSPRKGKIAIRHGAEGTMAKVHAPLVTLDLEDAPKLEAVKSPPAQAPAAPVVSAPVAEHAPQHLGATGTSHGHVLATPVTRHLAREHGLDLAHISGSGPSGRVLKADVLRVLESAPREMETAEATPVGMRLPQGMPASAPAPQQTSEGDRRVPLRGLRKAIAKKMVQSKQSAPHFTFVEECDATELKALRQRLNERLAKISPEGQAEKLSFLPFIAKAVMMALEKYPEVNANFDEAAQELIIRKEINLGIAASTPDGLTVPVVHDAGRKSLRALASEIARLGEAAREKRLKQEELVGGTFTISSLGQQGGLMATPIINHPEVAILGVHRMRPTPVVRDGRVEVRDIMHLSLACDHRVIDGALAATFAYEVIRLLESPELLMLGA